MMAGQLFWQAQKFLMGFMAYGLKKKYGEKTVLREIHFSLARGEAVALLGPNGAGKTTSFYIISGLLMPDAGHVFINRQEVTALPIHVRARFGLGYLPQEASIFRGLTVRGKYFGDFRNSSKR